MSRESKKHEKLERITNAAQKLFLAKGINAVTTSEIAAEAEIAAGTLFLYAKTKGELLLLAQNAAYEEAHEKGLKAATSQTEIVDAILALLAPIVKCNREHVENGRTYLQEVVFGSSMDVHRQKAIELMGATELAIFEIISKPSQRKPEEIHTLSKIVMATMFLTLSSPLNVDLSLKQILTELETQIKAMGINS